MAKEIKDVERFTPSNDPDDRELIVVETDDDVRYVFENSDGVRFSHRFVPDEPKLENRKSENYRLPQSVEEYIKAEFGSFEYLDGMIEEANRNHSASVKLSG